MDYIDIVFPLGTIKSLMRIGHRTRKAGFIHRPSAVLSRMITLDGGCPVQLTQERLKELYRYDPETGIFTRLNSSRRGRPQINQRPTDTPRYKSMKVDGRSYPAHRYVQKHIVPRAFKRRANVHQNT